MELVAIMELIIIFIAGLNVGILLGVSVFKLGMRMDANRIRYRERDTDAHTST